MVAILLHKTMSRRSLQGALRCTIITAPSVCSCSLRNDKHPRIHPHSKANSPTDVAPIPRVELTVGAFTSYLINAPVEAAAFTRIKSSILDAGDALRPASILDPGRSSHTSQKYERYD